MNKKNYNAFENIKVWWNDVLCYWRKRLNTAETPVQPMLICKWTPGTITASTSLLCGVRQADAYVSAEEVGLDSRGRTGVVSLL